MDCFFKTAKSSNYVKFSFLVIVGILLILFGFIGFLIPISNSGLTVLEADKLCQKASDPFLPNESEKPKVCEYTKFFNSIYFFIGMGLILIFWSGFLEKHFRHKKS